MSDARQPVASAPTWSRIEPRRRKVSTTLLLAMATALCVDMGGEYGVRNVVLAAIAPLLLLVHGKELRFGPRVLFAFALLIVWPSIAFAIGLANGADERLAFSQLQSTILGFALILIIGVTDPNASARVLSIALTITAAAAVALAIGLLLDLPEAASIVAQLHESGGGYFGKRSITDLEFAPNVYFKSSIFYVWAFTYTLLLNQHRFAMLFLVAMFAATSKASLLAALVVTMARTVSRASVRAFLFLAVAGAASVGLVFALSLDVLFNEIINMESNTVDVRMLHLESLLAHWAAHPWNFLVGFGLGTEFFSLAEGGLVSNIELDHLNTIRKYGLIWSLAFFGWILHRAWRAIRSADQQRRATGWALLVVFIVAGTNPVLVSPVFFLALAICHTPPANGARRS